MDFTRSNIPPAASAFIPYPVVAFYFILRTLLLTWGFGRVNRHLPSNQVARIRLRPRLIR